MQEILPGVWHWSARHPGIGKDVSSYWLAADGVVLNPMAPPEGFDALPGGERPRHVLLTNRLHWREAGPLAAAGATVHASRPGIDVFESDRPVTPFDDGDELPGGAVAHEIGGISPDEFALHLPAHRALALADGLVRMEPEGPVRFVPDELMGEDPERVKADLRRSLRTLLELDFDHLLLAHGDPVVGGGHAALEEAVEE